MAAYELHTESELHTDTEIKQTNNNDNNNNIDQNRVPVINEPIITSSGSSEDERTTRRVSFSRTISRNGRILRKSSDEESINEEQTESEPSDENNTRKTITGRNAHRKTRPLSSTEDSDAETSNKKEFLSAEPKEPKERSTIVDIVEFDRSDTSSNSEDEKATRRVSRTRRISKNSRILRKSSDEESINDEQTESKPAEENSTRKPRQRRIGVSAGTVRISWSNLRESQKISTTTLPEFDLYTNDEGLIGEENEETGLNSDSSKDETLEQPLSPEIQATPSNLDENLNVEETRIETIELTQSETVPDNEIETSTLAETNSQHDTCGDDVSKDENDSHIPTSPTRLSFPSPLTESPTDLEKKYKTIVISFQTDRYTLSKRLENQERSRDVAESGMDKELCKLSSLIKEMRKTEPSTYEYEAVWNVLHKQVDVLRNTAMKVSSQSEQHGCYQQDKETSSNIEVLISYAEGLRKHISKLDEEVQITRLDLQRFNHDHSDSYSDGYQKDYLMPNRTPYKPSGIENIYSDEKSEDNEEHHHGTTKKFRSFRDVGTALISLNRLTGKVGSGKSGGKSGKSPATPSKTKEESIDEIIAKKFILSNDHAVRSTGKYEMMLSGWSKYLTRNFMIYLIISLLLILVGCMIQKSYWNLP